MKLLRLFSAALPLFLSSCWGGQWVHSPERVEDIDLRTVQMQKTLDSLERVTEQNQILLRGIQAQAGMQAGEQTQNLRELIDQLERMLSYRSSSSAPSSSGEAQVAFDEAYHQYQQGGYSIAAEGFFEIVSKYPDSDVSDDALYFLALCHQNLGEIHRAIEELVAVYYKYPASDKTPPALARAAAIYRANSANAEADRLESLILDSYPSSEEARLITDRREQH